MPYRLGRGFCRGFELAYQAVYFTQQFRLVRAKTIDINISISAGNGQVGTAWIVSEMLHRFRAVANVDEVRRILHVDYLDRKLARSESALHAAFSSCPRPNILARDGGPQPVWGNGDVSDWQRASDKHLFVLATLERVHSNHSIFGAGKEEVVLPLSAMPGASSYLRFVLTVAATARLFS